MLFMEHLCISNTKGTNNLAACLQDMDPSNYIHSLNKVFESRIRLGVMSILMINEWVEYKTLKQMLEVTDGNLASHISALEKNEYIEVRKQFIGKRPNTTYKATKEGRKAFNAHLDVLENLLKQRE